MDKIKQAIELAKNLKKDAKQDENLLSEVSNNQYDVNKSIQYTETKNFTPSKKLLREKRIISPDGNGVIENSYKILRTQVLQAMRRNAWVSCGVASTKPSEGKSITAINLAISIAQESQHTVLLVDFDLNSPSIHEYFGIKPDYGIGDYLSSNIPIKEILFTPDIDSLVVLPGRRSLPNSSEALSSPKIVELVNELKSRYPNRIVIFDLPSLLKRDDVLAFSPYIDALLMVIEDGKTGQEHLQEAMDYLKKVNVLGSVLNKSGSKITLK